MQVANDFEIIFGNVAQQRSLVKRGIIFKNFKAKQKALKKYGIKITQNLRG